MKVVKGSDDVIFLEVLLAAILEKGTRGDNHVPVILLKTYIRMLRKKERGRRQSKYPRTFKSLSIYLINLI